MDSLLKVQPLEAILTEAITGGSEMRAIVSTAVLALWALTGSAPGIDPKDAPSDDLLFPLPPQEVAVGKFEQWQRESAKKPSSVTYTRVEYDRKAYWVAEASFGYGDPSVKIAVYASTKTGSFRRCLLAGPIKAGKLAVAVDAKTGMLNLGEEARSSTKGELVLSCNLKAVGVLP